MEQIKIDIVPVGVAPVAHASQFDNGRQIRFNLFNQGAPYTLTGAETVTMVVNGEEESITNTSDNYVIWDVAEEDCAEAGVIGCEIRIVLGSMLIGSKNFFLEVEMDPYNGKNIRTITVGPADICTFETTLPEPYQSVLVNIVATGGNGTPDNPNPINGYTEANITRCGVNFFDKATVNHGYLINGAGNYVSYPDNNVSDYTPVVEGVGFYLYGLTKHPNTNQDNFELFDGSKTKVGFANVKTWEYPYVIPSGVKYVRYTVHDDDINTAQFSPTNNATYEPYNGDTVTIAFGQTVYGGVLDVTRGKLTVTWKMVDMGDLTYVYTVGVMLSTALENSGTAGSVGSSNPMKCEVYETRAQRNYASSYSDKTCGLSIDGTQLIFKDSDYTDTGAFTTAMSGKKAVYELATPFDIDLTPEVISAIVGTNNVFADCGETEVKYLAEG